MQVTPALPWNSSVEGGIIQLREPLTLQQLLGGALDVVLKDGHDELNEGSFQIYPSDQKLYIGGSSLDYRITNVDTSSSSTQYSELILEKTLSADETLNSVSIHVPDVVVSPSLPWSDTTEGGVIHLAEPITYSQLVSGYLNFILDNNGVLIQAVCNEDSLGFVIKEPTNLGIVYYIQEFSGSLSELTLVKEASAPSGVSLHSVQISETYATPAFPWPANGGGTIHLKSPVSCQDILDGKIIFVTKSFNNFVKTNIEEVGNDIHLITGFSGDYYSIEKYEGTTAELTLSQVTQMNTQLWDAVLPQEAQIPILIDGLPFNATQNGMARILVINEDVTAQDMSENYLDIVITDENQSEDKQATYVHQESWVNVKYGDVIAFKLEKVNPYAWKLSRNNSDTAFIVKSIDYNQ